MRLAGMSPSFAKRQVSFLEGTGPQRDCWLIDGDRLRRVHVHPRRTYFTPSDAEDIPVPIESLSSVAVIACQEIDFGDGVDRIESLQCDWRLGAEISQEARWIGYTDFAIEVGQGSEGAQVSVSQASLSNSSPLSTDLSVSDSVGDLGGPRQPGETTGSAGPDPTTGATRLKRARQLDFLSRSRQLRRCHAR
ncbi:unnamed protein product [Prorocentrum cordatum]|uniref:Uncharacterized protein n=1 Tax=Prorocentrum cordatum TaxID=2364126 RepID=A0ABN9S327_9DINO|nr:unnamed protein product [Polarella glacialis]